MNENTLFWKMFGRRTVVCFTILSVLFLSCILRLTIICSKDYSEVANSQNYYRLKVSNLRGTIFDCNMKPITNNIKKTVAAVTPTPRAITGISSVLKGEELVNTLNALKNGKPVLCAVPQKIKCDGIYCTEVYSTENSLAQHTVGFCDASGKGVMGLQMAFEEVLNPKKASSLLYECNGLGEIFEGATPTLETDSSVIANGIVSTIDMNIQSIAEREADFLEKGAIVIADAKLGKIRGCVSRPNIDITNIENALNDPNSPFLNRSINAYSVGSVFKPCVAIAGIESKKGNFAYTCTGSCKIIDRIFKCHKPDGHGPISLKSGIANSCNTFFYNLGFSIGGEDIYKTAKNLNFGSSISICDGIETAKGSLPEIKKLSNPAHLANFSIGQGELSLSPVSILTLYCAIANCGTYYTPSILEGILKDGKLEENNMGKPTRIMKKETAEILKDCLKEVLSDGTGKEANPQNTTAAGKTATAQTGKFRDGVEICSGWFCGFFPFENPEYVVVIFSEDTALQTKSCSKIFADIADDLTNQKLSTLS